MGPYSEIVHTGYIRVPDSRFRDYKGPWLGPWNYRHLESLNPHETLRYSTLF